MHHPSPSVSPHPSHPPHPSTPSTAAGGGGGGAAASPHHSASPSAATPGSDPASPMAHASHMHAHLAHHPSSLMHFLPFQGSPVVTDQRAKYDNDELLRKLSRESEIRYTGYRDRPHDERVIRFTSDCREGRLDIAYVSTGTNLSLVRSIQNDDYFDFEREAGKVHVSASLIFNGVCVKWVGVLDLQRIDGVGQLQFDEVSARAFEGKSEDSSSSSGRDFPPISHGNPVTASA